MSVAILAITIAMVAWKYRQWHDELWTALTALQKRVHELEVALIKEECRKNEYHFTTRRGNDN
jgi:hypothetical protein